MKRSARAVCRHQDESPPRLTDMPLDPEPSTTAELSVKLLADLEHTEAAWFELWESGRPEFQATALRHLRDHMTWTFKRFELATLFDHEEGQRRLEGLSAHDGVCNSVEPAAA